MAYPTINSPYGFQPVNRYDGIPYAGATLQIPIGASYNTAIYNGSSVKIVQNGTIELSAATTCQNQEILRGAPRENHHSHGRHLPTGEH